MVRSTLDGFKQALVTAQVRLEPASGCLYHVEIDATPSNTICASPVPSSNRDDGTG